MTFLLGQQVYVVRAGVCQMGRSSEVLAGDDVELDQILSVCEEVSGRTVL